METDVLNLTSINSSDDDIGSEDGAYSHEYVPKSVINTLYGICIFMIVVGNVMVIVAVFLEPKLRTSPTNLLIVSLACSDLLVGCYYIPAVIMWDDALHLMLNVVICKLDGFLTLTSTGASVFTLIAIAVDRFRAIVTPFKPKITRLQASIMVAVAWACAMSYALYLPISVEYGAEVLFDGNQTFSRPYCALKPEYRDKHKYFRTSDCFVLFFIPLLVLLFLYVPMVYKLWIEKEPISSTGRRKKRAVKMLCMVVIIFFMMWLPYYSLYLYAQYGDIANRKINLRVYGLVAICLNFSNSWINPIIYGCFNENFRKAYKNAILCRIWTSSRRVFPTSFHESDVTNALGVDEQHARPSGSTLLKSASTKPTPSAKNRQVSPAPPNFVVSEHETGNT
ncbi:QRFP-like peptide receptor [Ptychodera flava]|uniref:QRFP-like peptide receptor n=1 Tax=Ptychodera flava TaxID=63121 RepID=UPI003969F61D